VWGKRCRVEAVGLGVNVEHDTRPYLLGVCGQAADKPYTMTVCFPARDEAADIELTLASFRGVADEMIIGIDPRTKDATREIAERYAEVVFDLDRPKGPEDDEAPSDGVHFSWIRNQCLDRASSDWIFMTEAHERLFEGQDRLLDLTSYVPRWAKMVAVSRTGNGMRWGFPWLTRRDSNIRYLRMTHNSPELPPEPVVGMREIVTRHERAKERAIARNKQRDVQNRKTLLEDWLVNHNVRSLHYLGAEYRSYSLEKSAQRLQQYLDEEHKDGYLRYHTRLLLSEVLVKLDRKNEAREVLMSATEDDWSRTEHWMRLGDLALERENFEEALQLYKYSATTIGRPPFGGWWIRESCYSYLPAQRLTQTHARLGQLDEALYWAKRVLELFPEDVAQANIEEAQAVVDTIEEHMARRRTKEVA
jgi:glycosyltransferase involved in cell wall biosynthesis